MQLQKMDHVEQRVRSYWYTDGLAELVGGGVFMLLGLFFAGQDWFRDHSLAQALFGSSLVIVLIWGALATRWIVNALKTRLTYPRTGYVSYRVDQKHAHRRRLMGAIAGAIFAALLVNIAVRVGSVSWVPAISGLVVGVILVYMKAQTSGLKRFYFLSGFSVILGLALSFGDLLLGYRLALFYGLMGLAFLVSGGIRLRHYLAENALPSEAPRER